MARNRYEIRIQSDEPLVLSAEDCVAKMRQHGKPLHPHSGHNRRRPQRLDAGDPKTGHEDSLYPDHTYLTQQYPS